MTDREFVEQSERKVKLAEAKTQGQFLAKHLQETSVDMTATEIVAEEDYIPKFAKAVASKNMLDRPVGFLVKTELGNVCKLLQVYDSTIYTQAPEELSAQWGFFWSQDPTKAKVFLAISTSPYMVDDCCLGVDGQVYRSVIDNNVWEPTAYPQGWEMVSV